MRTLYKAKDMQSRKPQILFIAPLPPPYSGPEVVSETLLNSALGEEFDLIYLPRNVHKQNKDRGRLSLVSASRLGILIFRTIRVIIYKKPKLVYTLLSQNFTGFMRDSILIMVCKIFSRKIILHFHGSNFENFYKNQPKFFRLYISFILRKIDALILEANWVKKFFSQFVPENRLRTIYNSISSEQFCDPERFDKQPNHEVNIFYMSHVSVAKGFIVLAEAIPKIIKENKNIKFLIAGGIINKERNILFSEDGQRLSFPDVNEAIAKIRQDQALSKHVDFLGPITSTDEKKRLFLQSNIFILPSYSEGCPMAVLEAMAWGLALVVTPVGALSEIVEDGVGGFLVKIGDPDELARKILTLAKDPKLTCKMGLNNKRLVELKFTVDAIASEVGEFFKELISYS